MSLSLNNGPIVPMPFFQNTYLVSSLAIAVLVAISQCTPPHEVMKADANVNQLYITVDTLRFDTIPAGIASHTLRFKIINTNAQAISIDAIYLEKGVSSPFKAFIQGLKQQRVENIFLRGKDSILIIVQALSDVAASKMPRKVSDFLAIDIKEGLRRIPILAYVIDLQKINQDTLYTDTYWTDSAAYYLESNLVVAKGATLYIQKGSIIFSKGDVSLIVYGKLVCMGDSGSRNQILWQGIRTDGIYNKTPGLWYGIKLKTGSGPHMFQYTVIKNAINGLEISDSTSTTLQQILLENVKIENMSGYGVKAYGVNLTAYNLIIANTRLDGLLLTNAGSVDIRHSTIVNYPVVFEKTGVAVRVKTSTSAAGPTQLYSTNNIWWGTTNEEFVIDSPESLKPDILTFKRNLIRSASKISDTSNYYGLDYNPALFRNIAINDLTPMPESPIKSLGIKQREPIIDFNGKKRYRDTISRPDLGAINVWIP